MGLNDTLWDDPPSPTSGCDEQDFDSSVPGSVRNDSRLSVNTGLSQTLMIFCFVTAPKLKTETFISSNHHGIDLVSHAEHANLNDSVGDRMIG